MTSTLTASQGTSAKSTRPTRVLMLTHRLPYPPDRGDRIRSYHLLKHLSRHFDLAVACVSDEPVWLQHHQLLRTMARRVTLQPISTKWSALRGAAALALGRPVTPDWHFRVGLGQQILQWHEQQPFDVVLTFCTGMINYARLLVPPHEPGPDHGSVPAHPRHILDLVDVDSMKWESYARASWPPLRWVYGAEASRLRGIESGRYDHFDGITVVSEAEAVAYRQCVGQHPGLTVVRNGVDIGYFHPLADPDNHALVFVGVLNYRPNTEGITFFARQVMPLLRERVPDAHLFIVGRHPTAAVLELSQIPGVEVVGSVPDVRQYLARSSLVVAPLLLARGVQNKVLEAMASQRAVVCSSGAAKGIDATPGSHLAVADRPQEWVDQISALLADRSRRAAMAAAAREHVEAVYSWEEAIKPMVKLISQ